jgi:hypothetical protein
MVALRLLHSEMHVLHLFNGSGRAWSMHQIELLSSNCDWAPQASDVSRSDTMRMDLDTDA